jgi:hypothetical protein
MSGLVLLGVWAAFTTASVAVLLWVADHDTLADLPDTHDRDACDECAWADVVALTGSDDWKRWESELRERAS